ncbi:MAG: rhomboid family intramembrane serine protease [Actinomycetia bacterium]|nr:rhomboid family intramembrane serine protease [Actinomycetes bacterium]
MTQASVGFHCPECTSSGAQKVIRAQDLSRARPPVTIALIILNVGAYVIQDLVVGDPPATVQWWGLLFGPAVQEGEWWRIVTSGFLHGSLLHIGFNMYALWIFGPTLERGLGPIRFGLAYAAGLLGGAMAVLLFNFETPTLGASGAVLGLAGALAAVLWSRGIAITQTSLGGIFIINLALPLLVSGISFWGHFGGIAAGFVAGWLLSWLPDRYNQSMGVAVGTTVGLCVILAGVALAGPAALGF